MEASSTRLAILTVGVEEPVPSGQEHWHCCQSASAKTPKVTSRCWIVPVSADESPAASRKHCHCWRWHLQPAAVTPSKRLMPENNRECMPSKTVVSGGREWPRLRRQYHKTMLLE